MNKMHILIIGLVMLLAFASNVSAIAYTRDEWFGSWESFYYSCWSPIVDQLEGFVPIIQLGCEG